VHLQKLVARVQRLWRNVQPILLSRQLPSGPAGEQTSSAANHPHASRAVRDDADKIAGLRHRGRAS